jgi:hypothetical protein
MKGVMVVAIYNILPRLGNKIGPNADTYGRASSISSKPAYSPGTVITQPWVLEAVERRRPALKNAA